MGLFLGDVSCVGLEYLWVLYLITAIYKKKLYIVDYRWTVTLGLMRGILQTESDEKRRLSLNHARFVLVSQCEVLQCES